MLFISYLQPAKRLYNWFGRRIHLYPTPSDQVAQFHRSATNTRFRETLFVINVSADYAIEQSRRRGPVSDKHYPPPWEAVSTTLHTRVRGSKPANRSIIKKESEIDYGTLN